MPRGLGDISCSAPAFFAYYGGTALEVNTACRRALLPLGNPGPTGRRQREIALCRRNQNWRLPNSAR
jgi:hypothetical protein